jgi:hypothetical protein
MMKPTLRAGAAALVVDPPLGLPMVGAVRRDWRAHGRIGHLEVSAIAFDCGGVRVVLCGVDTLGIQSPEIDELRTRVAEATRAGLAGVLINFSHTHHAPPGGRTIYGAFGERDTEPDDATLAYIAELHRRVVDVCVLACDRLEPAWVRWGLGSADRGYNRRRRDPDGRVRTLDWHEGGMLDRSVPTLQAVRADNSPIATLVTYGAHTVTTDLNAPGYSPDYVGPLRDAVRRWTGGECVFFLGASGNVMPMVAFEHGDTERTAMGEDIALQALHALSGPPIRPSRLGRSDGFKSGTPVLAYQWRPVEDPTPVLLAAERRVTFPLQELPSLDEIVALRDRSARELAAAEAAGASEPELRIMRFHGYNWATLIEAELRSGNPRTGVEGSICAVRIGDGVITTSPGETFTEIGLAVKERSPATVTLYAGYTNGAVSYLPIASEFPLGGYEPDYGNKTYGLPAQVTPSTDRLLVETAVTLVRSLFPERESPQHHDDWLATGALPSLPPPPLATRPRSPD